jgi:hypothetical protein
MNAIAESFQNYVQTVYTTGPITDRQRVELERAFFAGFHASMQIAGHVSSQYDEDTACSVLMEMGKEIEAYVERIKRDWVASN